MSQDKKKLGSATIKSRPGGCEQDLHLQINIRLNLDEVAEVEARTLRVGARRQPTKRELIDVASRIYDARRTRSEVLDAKLFGEPAWDMLLALYCLPARSLIMSISALNDCADIPQSTGDRWQKVLLSDGLIERGPEEVDVGSQIVRLTSRGRTLMEDYLSRLFYCEAPVPPAPRAIGSSNEADAKASRCPMA